MTKHAIKIHDDGIRLLDIIPTKHGAMLRDNGQLEGDKRDLVLIGYDSLDTVLSTLSAIRNADRLGVKVEVLASYCGYLCNRLDEHGKLMVLSYMSPYVKMGDFPMYDLSTNYTYKVGEVIDVGFEYMHLIKDWSVPAAPPTGEVSI